MGWFKDTSKTPTSQLAADRNARDPLPIKANIGDIYRLLREVRVSLGGHQSLLANATVTATKAREVIQNVHDLATRTHNEVAAMRKTMDSILLELRGLNEVAGHDDPK